MPQESNESSLCGIWIDSSANCARLAFEDGDGLRRTETQPFQPFVWAMSEAELAAPKTAGVTTLKGDGEFDQLVTFSEFREYQDFIKERARDSTIDWLRQLEQQHLLATRQRVFKDMHFGELRRMQLDIETYSSVEGSFPDPSRKKDRVLAIGLRCGEKIESLILQEHSEEAETELLHTLNECIQALDPDTIEGHNIFKFDLEYLSIRAKRLRVPCEWGRFGQKARFRKSRLRVAERWIDYPRCDLPGRSVIDTYLLAQIYDITTRELMSYGLKDVARHLGVTPADGEGRAYIEGNQIQIAFEEDRDRFIAYLEDDLRETKDVAGLLLPTYFEQAKAFPTTLQEACLRGTASKVDLVLLEEYYHRKAACPMPGETAAYPGGYTANFQEGVYKHVLHFDVASLYPSILLMLGKNPHRDTEGVFIPMLQNLREYRLEYKKLAREAEDPVMASEYDARQASFKILINSFYGYLGFSAARFGDVELAAEVTAKGRELLQGLIAFFQRDDCQPLEADTDGIYVASETFFHNEATLLAEAQETLPEGIELEYDGKYVSMFCYKAKNYALNDGKRTIIRGSALRSRGIEPFLRELTMSLISFLLGASDDDPAELANADEKALLSEEMGVAHLAKSEILSQNPEAYRKKIEAGGKPRRASAEVALMMDKPVSMGDRVSYFIGPREKGQTADWQRARPLDQYNKETLKYDSAYYVKKLNDWRKRYAPFHPKLLEDAAQGELF